MRELSRIEAATVEFHHFLGVNPQLARHMSVVDQTIAGDDIAVGQQSSTGNAGYFSKR